MTTLSIQPPFPIFSDRDGQPLENGYIWVGTANLNPITNPVAVYWDAGLTQPAALPVRTINGYPANNGTPGRLYVASDFSITVQDAKGSLVYNAPAVTDRYNDVVVTGADASEVSFLQAGSGAQPRTAQAKMREWVSPEDFGAVGDGLTNDTTALQNALNTGKMVRGTPGATYFINPLTQNTARQVIDMRGCTLKLRPSQSSFMLTLSGTGAQVLGGVWDGNKAAGQSTTDAYYDHAAVCILADYCVVDGIRGQNSAGIGIKGASNCNYATVRNCTVVDWNVQGIYIEGTTADSIGNVVHNNIVTVGLNTGVGIYITGSSPSPFTYKQKRWRVCENIVTGPTNPAATDIGITLRGVDGICANNHVINCDLGITADITSRSTFTGNRVEFTGTPSAGYCYELNGGYNTFAGNIAKGGKYGFVSAPNSALNCDGTAITGNVFELQTIRGVYFSTTGGGNTANYLTISGNTFNYASAGASREAIRFNGDTRYSTITGNNFIGPGSAVSGGRAIYLDSAYGDVQMCSNRMQGWERPVALYYASATAYNRVMFVGNDLSSDMTADGNWLNREGSATYGNGIKQMWNSAGGFQEINYVDRSTNLLITWNGSGTPEGVITAAVGSLYMNTAGGAGTVLYVKQTGAGNTGWGAK
jgi:hypothetical protein